MIDSESLAKWAASRAKETMNCPSPACVAIRYLLIRNIDGKIRELTCFGEIEVPLMGITSLGTAINILDRLRDFLTEIGKVHE